MDEKQKTIAALLNPGVIPVLRLPGIDKLLALGEALDAGGLTTLELTLTTPQALEGIRTASSHFADRLTMGAGTVLDGETARQAILAGARFIVSPVLAEDIIATCHRYSIPVLCGAFTPTEVLRAWEAGADFVKVFPGEVGGSRYIKALKGPFPQIEFIPTGGIDLETIGDFMRAGCAAVGVGRALVSPAAFEKGEWESISATARDFVTAIKNARSSAL